MSISIIPQLRAAIPDDVPDLALTNHLLPLDLPSQSVVYLADRPGTRYGVTSRGTHDMVRADRVLLRQFLATKIPCQMGKRAVSFEELPESVTVRFEDGTSATGNILVCADGTNSARKPNSLPPSHRLRALHSFWLSSELTKASTGNSVRGQLLGRELKPQLLPVASIGGEVTLSGKDFENELRLGHSSRSNFFSEPAEPGLPVVHIFCALKRVLPDGHSGEYYWFTIWVDDNVADPAHWTKTASRKELHDFVIRTTRGMEPRVRNIVDLTPVDKLIGDPFPQRALMLTDLPIGRVTLLGDAAHCMPPSKSQEDPVQCEMTRRRTLILTYFISARRGRCTCDDGRAETCRVHR